MAKKPTKKDKKHIQKWKKDYEIWGNVTCGCGYGYFNEKGKWISGADVCNDPRLKNPRWPGGYRDPIQQQDWTSESSGV